MLLLSWKWSLSKKFASLTPGTHLDGHKSSENWEIIHKEQLVRRQQRSIKRREKATLFFSLLNTYWIQDMHGLKIWPISSKREGCQKWWAVLRSYSKIMRKQRPGPQLLFIPPKSISGFSHRNNCWSFCWSSRKNMTLPERSQGIFKFYWFIFSNLLRLGNFANTTEKCLQGRFWISEIQKYSQKHAVIGSGQEFLWIFF